jgi:hypothetical protein
MERSVGFEPTGRFLFVPLQLSIGESQIFTHSLIYSLSMTTEQLKDLKARVSALRGYL